MGEQRTRVEARAIARGRDARCRVAMEGLILDSSVGLGSVSSTGGTSVVRNPWMDMVRAGTAGATPPPSPEPSPDGYVPGAVGSIVPTLPAPVTAPSLSPAMPHELQATDLSADAPSALGLVSRLGLAVMGAVMLAGTVSPALAAPTTASVAISAAQAASKASESSLLDLEPTTLPANVAFANPYLVDQEIERAAERAQVPPDLLKAVAWQESGWMHYSRAGVQRNANRNKAGSVVSTDWGIVQVNDRAHPRAFPRARVDPRYNLEFGGRLLRSLYQETGDWERAIERYNGINSAYPKAIKHHRSVKPWTVDVAKGELTLHQAERQHVEARKSAAVKLVEMKEKRVEQARQHVEKLGGGIAADSLPAATRKVLTAASAALDKAQAEAASARSTLGSLTTRATRLDQAIPRLEEKVQKESSRLKEVKLREVAERKAHVAQRKAHVAQRAHISR